MAQQIEDLIPDYIRGLPVYIPGRPIEDVERELKIRAIKLASNENPLGPSPKAIEAARRALPESHRYPDGGTLRLREKLAQIHGVSAGRNLRGARLERNSRSCRAPDARPWARRRNF